MKSAYLYVRVSTDEQKRRGYSLPEQEDRLIKYCQSNNIYVKGIYREDFSAKDFNRPEWKRLVSELRKGRAREENNILFIKWDRFSRNIQYAYEMLGILRKLNVSAMAIDQQIDLSVPESSVMLAIYLSVPEAENTRRAMNTLNGIRKAKEMGRYPNKAPVGYVNMSSLDGRKIIVPKQPEGGIIRWVFRQLAKNVYKIGDLCEMAVNKGLRSTRSNFSKLIRNPVYCGLIPLKLGNGETVMIKGIHEPLIPETLFYEVQDVINTKRKVSTIRGDFRSAFFLAGFLVCPLCRKKLTGSFSQGNTRKYAYYHCRKGCRARVRADKLNYSYRDQPQKLELSERVNDLFSIILADWNVDAHKLEVLYERQALRRQLGEQETLLSRARKLFVENILKHDDYSEMKSEFRRITDGIKRELCNVATKLRTIEEQRKLDLRSSIDIFRGFDSLDTADKSNWSVFFLLWT
ncbi:MULTISPECIES: recombinase family protein [Mucilaginibacter]|uniref:Recombinase family protein n=1 Tax=Mucilaginibacter rubeus TaxID=2027860 RepID=A0ABX7UE18_9SPHI|nr:MULTISPECIES: recombinase family protein [Mucilaginibacter]QTE44362.1 recombinase family protein [Mucilaginibacter rubeus]QTE50962.1 recombinase family protein [Mucilaginibacter rubeus]QTE56045.1 recombinase family protein [Mucilaginibacter rubeus]QTE64491.1 recombinase family protein [Mucilaginibacter rubeus]QTF63250.1 recombinase family protein [Mucilaginibacter rubeus]